MRSVWTCEKHNKHNIKCECTTLGWYAIANVRELNTKVVVLGVQHCEWQMNVRWVDQLKDIKMMSDVERVYYVLLLDKRKVQMETIS